MRARLSPSPAPAVAGLAGASTQRRLARWRTSSVWATEALLVGLACLASVCLFYREVIFAHRTFLPFGSPAEVMGPAPPWQFDGTVRPNPYRLDAGGSAWQLEPWAAVVASSYASGQLPLWNPHQFFGTPLAADAQPGAFDLLRLPALLTTHARGWDLYYLSQAALGLVLTYVFGRAVGLRPVAAFVAGVAYSFSGFTFIRGNMHYAEAYHLLPGLLWGSELLVRGALRRGLLVLALGAALSTLVGMPEVTLLVFLYAASYGAFRAAWAAWESVGERSWPRLGQRVAALGLGWIVGLGLSAPLLGPLVEYVGLSFNIHPPERALGLLYLPLRGLAYVGVPYIEGLPAQGLGPGGLTAVDDYSGASVLVLALVGALAWRRLGGRLQSVTVFALGSALIWGAKLYGLPGWNLLGGLPLLQQTLIYIFGTPLLGLSLALLAGAGLHALASGRLDRRATLLAGGLFVGYLAVAAGLNWSTLQAAGVRHMLGTVGLALAAGGGAWLCVWLAIGRTRSREWAALAAGGVVIAELVVLAPRDVYSDRYDSLAEPPYVRWLQQQQTSGQPFRVFSNDGLLYPDYASAFGLDDVRDVDALYPRRTWDFVHLFLSPSTSDRYVGGFGHPELPTDVFANKWLDLSNVRYLLRPADQRPSDASLAETIVAANYPPTAALHVAQLSIDGQRREVLDQRTPGEVVWHLRPTAAQPQLTFFVGLNPQGPPTQAAQFTVAVQRDGQRQVVYQHALDAARPSDRHWTAGSVDLGPFTDQPIDLIFQTQSQAPDSGVAYAAWGDLHLSPAPDAGQFRQVYAGEVSIWENTHAQPRAFLVGQMVPAHDQAEAIARMQAPDFDPRTMAVVEGAAGLPERTDAAPAAGEARITSYGQQRVEVAVAADRPALLVLTDSLYPGWTAHVDGAEAPIVPTDLAFRGVVVPAGAHQVTFEYAPVSFRLGLLVAAAALALLGVAIMCRPLRLRLGVPT